MLRQREIKINENGSDVMARFIIKTDNPSLADREYPFTGEINGDIIQGIARIVYDVTS